MKKVEDHFSEAEDVKIDHLDGLTRVNLGDWWFNLRPSNTEPLLRLNVEADDEGNYGAPARRVAGVDKKIGLRLQASGQQIRDGTSDKATPPLSIAGAFLLRAWQARSLKPVA